MRRIVYEVEKINSNKQLEKQNDWSFEKQKIAFKLINNASILTDAVQTCRNILEKNPDSELKVAIAKIDGVIEELKIDFKKNYKF